MTARVARTPLWVLLALAATAVSYLAGLWQGQRDAMRMLQMEAAANLTQRLETLSSLQLGDVGQAVMNLEQEADQLILGIAANPGADRRVLLSAKAYRSVVPPPQPRASALAAVFDALPAPKTSDCSNAVQLLLRTRAGSSEK